MKVTKNKTEHMAVNEKIGGQRNVQRVGFKSEKTEVLRINSLEQQVGMAGGGEHMSFLFSLCFFSQF